MRGNQSSFMTKTLSKSIIIRSKLRSRFPQKYSEKKDGVNFIRKLKRIFCKYY